MNFNFTGALSDNQLVEEVKRLAGRARRAALIRALVEFDERKMYLREGCLSLFTSCTQVPHLSEAAAYNRIEAARAARRFPVVLEAIEQGSLTLTSIGLLAPHLTDENHLRVLAGAARRSRREVEELVAMLNPRPPSLAGNTISTRRGCSSGTRRFSWARRDHCGCWIPVKPRPIRRRCAKRRPPRAHLNSKAFRRGGTAIDETA